MDEGSARVRLETMTAASVGPSLTDAELDELLLMARRPDVYEALPSDTDWVPTWNLDYAAAEGWRWKAGKVAGNFDFTTDGQGFNRAQVYDHCLQQAARYARRGGLSTMLTAHYDALTTAEVGNVDS